MPVPRLPIIKALLNKNKPDEAAVLMKEDGVKLSDIYDTDKTMYHGTPMQYDEMNPNSFYSDSSEIANRYAYDRSRGTAGPNIRPVHPPKGEFYNAKDLEDIANKNDEWIDDDFPWINVDRNVDGNLYKYLDQDANKGVEFNWPASEHEPVATTERMIFNSDDAIPTTFAKSFIAKNPKLASMLPLGIAGIASLQSEDANALYLGPKAPGADLAKLAEARAAEKAGWSKAKIWDKFGWGRGIGRDKEWRYRIDDRGASVKLDPLTGKYKLTHPELAKHEPDAMNVDITHDADLKGLGSYAPKTDKIKLGPGRNHERHAGTALHELQHSLQKRYNFAAGASDTESPYSFSQFIDKLREDTYKQGLAIAMRDPDVAAKIKADPDLADMYAERAIVNSPRLTKTLDDTAEWHRIRKDPETRYHHSAGEMEAKEVEGDYNLSKAFKKPQPPRHILYETKFNPIVRKTSEDVRGVSQSNQHVPGSRAHLAAGLPISRNLTTSRDITNNILSRGHPGDRIEPTKGAGVKDFGNALMNFDTPYGKVFSPMGKAIYDAPDKKSKQQTVSNALGGLSSITGPVSSVIAGLFSALLDEGQGVIE